MYVIIMVAIMIFCSILLNRYVLFLYLRHTNWEGGGLRNFRGVETFSGRVAIFSGRFKIFCEGLRFFRKGLRFFGTG